MYEAAYQICEDKSMLKAYLYASRRYMTKEEYRNLLQKSVMYQEMEFDIAEDIARISNSIKTLQYEDSLENWKNQYRLLSEGEI